MQARDVVQENGDGEGSSASPSFPLQPKAPAKISCLACRAAKRKCLTPDALTVCKRCTDQGLECEYKKHRRGRRKKVPDEPNGSGTTRAESSGRSRSPEHRDYLPSSRDRRERSRDHDRDLRDISMHSSSRATAATAAATNNGPDTPRRRLDISFSHVVPIEGDSSREMHPDLHVQLPDGAAYLPPPSAAPPPENPALVRTGCPDPVMSGFLTEADAYEMFEFYFHHLNVTVAVLDPVLHTATYCREKSPLLFSAILTVTAKIIRPKAYSSCLLVSNRLVGQAVEFGLCSIEVVQAILVLTHWKKADDATSWRKTGYAIRMAQELRLNQRAPRPLPRNERAAREVLNRERCWLNLVVADYHLAMHHSLPRMITEDDVDDPMEWITDHPHLPCPGEAVIAPWISFSRLCRLFADILASMNGSHSNLRSLHWLEAEWKRWRKRWLERNTEYNFMQQQIAMIKMCDCLFHFHIAEYRLLFAARYRTNEDHVDTTEPSQLSYAFVQCTDVALALLEVFQTEFVANGMLPFCFNLTWVAVAITSVWLIKNIGGMEQPDRMRVIRTLTEVSDSTADSSCSSDDMAAYMHRLVKHLLGSLSPEWQLNATAPPGNPPVVASPGPPGHGSGAWTMPSATQMIQEHLWHEPPATTWGDIVAGAQRAGGGTPGQVPASGAQAPQNTIPQPALPMLSDGVGGGLGTDVLFPAADDDIWKLLFPL